MMAEFAETIDSTPPTAMSAHWFDTLLSYCLVLGLIMISGNPALPMLFGGDRLLLVFSMVLGVLAAYVVYSGQSRTPLRAMWPIAVFSGLLIVQAFVFQILPLSTYLGFLCRLFIAFAVLLIVPRFPRKFVDVMYVITWSSLFFWILGVVGVAERLVGMFAVRKGGTVTLFVHTYEYWLGESGTLSARNAGMFWEPGALAGYLVLALVFLGVLSHQYTQRQYRRRLLLFSLAVLTTMSTAGYLMLPLVWLFHLAVQRKRETLSRLIWLSPVIVIVAVWAYFHFDFVGQKIEHQYTTTMEHADTVEDQANLSRVQSRWYLTRLGSIIFDWDYIRRRPLTGWGIAPETRFALHRGGEGMRLAMGNGLTDFTARFGFLGLLAFIIFIWRGFALLAGGRAGVGFLAAVILILVLNGEQFLNYPLFLSLMFLPYCAACSRSARQYEDEPEPIRTHDADDAQLLSTSA